MWVGSLGSNGSACEMDQVSFMAELVHSALGLPTLLLSFRSCTELPNILSSRLENVDMLIGSYLSY